MVGLVVECDLVTLQGFHGTTRESGEEIVRTQTFKPSEKITDWLGTGIYFYFEKIHADDWCTKRDYKDSMVLSACVCAEENEILDLRTDDGKATFLEIQDMLGQYGKLEQTWQAAERNQCMVANAIWKACEYLKILAGDFAPKKTEFPTLTDARPRRPEFCVRSNDYIREIKEAI